MNQINSTPEASANVTDPHLAQLVDRIERMEEEKHNIMADIREIYAEAKAKGYDPKIMRKVVSIRKQDPADIAETEALLDTYLAALGQ
ncbi:MAG: DUF2312 domain-containing protein [Alphaproteobacteria bacterium]